MLVFRGKEIEWNVYLAGGTYAHRCSVFGSCNIFISESREVRCAEGHGHEFLFIEEARNRTLNVE